MQSNKWYIQKINNCHYLSKKEKSVLAAMFSMNDGQYLIYTTYKEIMAISGMSYITVKQGLHDLAKKDLLKIDNNTRGAREKEFVLNRDKIDEILSKGKRNIPILEVTPEPKPKTNSCLKKFVNLLFFRR